MSDPAERSRIEEALKNDKLAKVTQLKKTKKEAEDRRRVLGLRNGGSTVGLGDANGVELPPEISLETLLKNSESVQLRKGDDAIKTLAMDESQLEKMPMAAQPPQLQSTLLPYQLQVRRTPRNALIIDMMLTVGRASRGCSPKNSRNCQRLVPTA